jgi:hypothetical protein
MRVKLHNNAKKYMERMSETDLTDEEAELIAKGMNDYDRDPSIFTDWDIVKKGLGLASGNIVTHNTPSLFQ